MNNTRKILGRYITNFIIFGVIIGAIAFVAEMTLINNYSLVNSIAVFIFILAIFILSTFLVHIISVNRALKNAELSKGKKITLIKTTRVVLGMIAIILLFVDLIAFVNIEKSIEKDYKNVEVPKLEALVANEDISEEYSIQVQNEDLENIHSVIYMYMGTKEIADIIVYLAVAAYMESKISKVNDEKEVLEKDAEK